MPVIHIIYHYLYLHYIFLVFFLLFFFFIFWLNFFFIIPSSYSVLKVALATHMFASFSVWSVCTLPGLIKKFWISCYLLSVNIYKKGKTFMQLNSRKLQMNLLCKVRSFQEHSCAILNSLKIMIIFNNVEWTEDRATVFSKWTDFKSTIFFCPDSLFCPYMDLISVDLLFIDLLKIFLKQNRLLNRSKFLLK